MTAEHEPQPIVNWPVLVPLCLWSLCAATALAAGLLLNGLREESYKPKVMKPAEPAVTESAGE